MVITCDIVLQVPDYEDRLSKFERMCVVKTFREDRTLIAASDYIADTLGQRFVESVPLSMERAWAESHRNSPLICLLSPGSDPTKLIEDLAKRKKIKTLGVSMGQGQEVIARKYMVTATAEGQWVLLQNTHLGLGYLTEVEQFLVKAEDLHEDFRYDCFAMQRMVRLHVNQQVCCVHDHMQHTGVMSTVWASNSLAMTLIIEIYRPFVVCQ